MFIQKLCRFLLVVSANATIVYLWYGDDIKYVPFASLLAIVVLTGIAIRVVKMTPGWWQLVILGVAGMLSISSIATFLEWYGFDKAATYWLSVIIVAFLIVWTTDPKPARA